MTSIITRVFDYLGNGGWSTEEIDLGGGYAAGTDRLVARLTGVTFTAGQSTQIDWTDADGFQAGTAVAVVGSRIQFLEGGCYSVQVAFPHGLIDPDTTETVPARLAVPLLGTEWADGDDASQTDGQTTAIAGFSASYVYPQNAGDLLGASVTVDGAVDGVAASVFATIVKLSDVAAGDEFA